MSDRPAEEMLPHELVEARQRSGCAFVPVSPAFEWHSWHLPLGTDALISEAVCRLVAAEVGGAWFRPLSLGLDAWRNEQELLAWGFGQEDRVFGMRFPDVPLCSEYCELPELRAAVRNRLYAIRLSGFRHAFLVNHHGGKGQWPALAELAQECSEEGFRVHAVRTGQFSDVRHETLRVGGHAGLSETTWVMAFRPDLVDLSRQQDGELSVRHCGILHPSPVIGAEHNPRHASAAVAADLRRSVVENFAQFARQVAGLR